MSVHLCVENSFSWWNSLFLFFNLKHQIDWYIKHTIYFWRVPCGIHIELLSYHKKNKNNNWKLLLSQLLPNLCQFSESAIISESSEDTVSWLFFKKQLLSKSFSARSVLGKPCRAFNNIWHLLELWRVFWCELLDILCCVQVKFTEQKGK